MTLNHLMWSPPPDQLTLSVDEVHAWRIELDLARSHAASAESPLSEDELQRAGRFRFPRDRHRFVAGRTALRTVLGRHLKIEPRQVEFRYGPSGKPALADQHAGASIRFNLSHSEGLALLAIAPGREVGVDLERLRVDLKDEEIAQRFFSSGEIAALRALPEDARRQAFFAGWTRKEAYIKAKGEGLSMPLDRFVVSLAAGDHDALLRTEGDREEASRWTIRDIAVGSGYKAAICVEGRNWRLKCWQFPGPGASKPQWTSSGMAKAEAYS